MENSGAFASSTCVRLERRAGHIAGPTLLASQLATLEEPDEPHVLTVDATAEPEAILREVREAFGLPRV